MRVVFALSAAALAIEIGTVPVHAQQNTGARQQGSAVTPKRDPDTKKALPVADYARWRTIATPVISSDGNWVAWSYAQVRRDDQLHVKQVDGNREIVVEGGTRPMFSDDARWVAYYVSPPAAPAGRGGRGGRGGVAGGPGATTPAAPARKAELVNLATGDKTTWDDVATFEFNKGSTVFAVHRARAVPAPQYEGADLIVRDLEAGTDRLIGSVNEFAFNKSGALLAFTVDAANETGNGLYVSSLADGQDRVLENAREHYARLAWSDDGSALAAIHGTDTDTLAQRENAIIAVTGLAGKTVHRVAIAAGTHGMPANFVASEKGTLTWSEHDDRLFFGLKSQDRKPKPVTGDTLVAPSDVDIYHANDDRIQSVQRSQATADRNRTDRAALDLASEKILRVADSTTRIVQVTKDGKWAVVGDDRKYVSDYQQARADYYRVNVATGERTPMLTAQIRTLGLTPDSKYFLYWKNKQVWSYELATNTHRDITDKVPVSFVNAEEDHVVEKPPYGVAGYSTDGKSVILEHRFDLWQVSLDGSAPAVNLTKGAGTRGDMRLRWVNLDPEAPAPTGRGGGGRGGFGSNDNKIDLSKPLFLSAYGEYTKKSGFFELANGRLEQLVYDDKNFGRPEKAANADRFLFTREDWTEFPDLRVSNHSFNNSIKISDANPQQAEYRWGHRVLFDFTDKDGHKLQGTLAIPDGYEPGTRLPMLVNFYEKNSQNLHIYQVPKYATGPQFAGFVSNGYLVMQPDIYFHTRTSHSDMLESVENAVKKVVEMGYADPKHVGLQGHSYSGGGSAYIAGHSTMFAAVVSGAAPIDLTTEFNTLFRGSGQNNQGYDMTGQGRYGTDPYTDPKLYYDQSPISGVKTMNTPLLQMQGDNDQTVEWLQDVEWYNALRFNKKPVIFLSYPGEDHGLRKLENQVDYETRISEFFDHYLKGAPAPKWMIDGERYIDKDKRPALPISVEKKTGGRR
ncbi:MAG TPA: prolyl oligopeptidase family serine peptidase [Gemmatimonadaceae bacterium]|nr:prolyl oligopeptidase family serine peptidase [Gemmatimonadaceae bacterium]